MNEEPECTAHTFPSTKMRLTHKKHRTEVNKKLVEKWLSNKG
jgi:hypothetical protein